MNIKTEDSFFFPQDLIVKNFKVASRSWNCSIHGNVEDYRISSSIPGHEMNLCLKCYLEFLKRNGVQELTRI